MVSMPCAITDPRLGLIFMSLYALVQGSLNSYLPSMITTIEKRFDLDTSSMGLLLSANDIGYLSCIMFIAYFGGKGNQVRVLVASAVGLAISGFILGLPFLVYGPKYTVEELQSSGTANSTLQQGLNIGEKATMRWRCLVNSTSSIDSTNGWQKGNTYRHTGAFAIQMLGGIINGIAACPFWNIGICFLDDMAGTKSGVYLGVLFAIRSIAPMIGFSIGAWVNTLHETLGMRAKDYPGGQRDPYWISAWWLGLFILSIAVLSTAPFLASFKIKALTKRKDDEAQEMESMNGPEMEKEEVKKSNAVDVAPGALSNFSFKEFITLLANLWTNPVYVFLVVGMIFEVFSLVSLFSFFPKFLEFHFRLSATRANVFTAFGLAGSSVVSMVTSGLVANFCPMTTRGKNLYHAIVNFVSNILFAILFLFSCDNVTTDGQLSATPNVTCAPANCSCPIMYKPVCAGGQTFLSACHAGCLGFNNATSTYTDCLCNGTNAIQGSCEGECKLIYPYIVIFFIVKVIGSIASVQFTQIFIKLSSKDNKAVALATIGFLFGILGMALPPTSGAIMDTACLLRHASPKGKSFCTIYDAKRLGLILHAIAFGVMLPACVFYFLSWHFTPDDEEPPTRQKKKKSSRKEKEEAADIAQVMGAATQFGSVSSLTASKK